MLLNVSLIKSAQTGKFVLQGEKMRKTILTMSLLVILTLSLTQLATAQWKDNVFTNESSGDVYVAFTTYRPATDDIPLGWRTTAWYLIEPDDSHTFQAFGDNAIYYLIYQASTESYIKPENAKTFRAWRYDPAFKIVSEDEPDTFTPAADLLHAEPRQRATIKESRDYFKSANTGSVTVTPTGVTAPLAELEEEEETVGLPDPPETVGLPDDAEEAPESHTLGSVRFTNGLPSSINSGDKDVVEVQALSTEGVAMSGVSITFSTNNSDTLGFTRSSGTTDASGKFSTTVQTKNKTSGSWNDTGTTYTPSRSDSITATASSGSVTRTATASTQVLPISRERQTSSQYFSSKPAADRNVGIFTAEPVWYWTEWRNLRFTVPQCPTLLHWWGYASLPDTVDDPFVDEEKIEQENSDSIRKTGDRSWQVRVRIKEHEAEPSAVYVSVKARCEFIEGRFGFGAPSLRQVSLHPETRHLSETWQELSAVPPKTVLLANYPNPFNPETWIPYHLSDPAEVTLRIYSADGQLVRTLALGHQDAGIYESKSRAAYWDGRNSVGERVASGLYFYTLTAGDFAATNKMLIMK